MRDKFPILKNIAYLDNAATTQKPLCVINKIKQFYEENNANPRRGIYGLSVRATDVLDSSRRVVSKFLNADFSEVFFVKNATDGFNSLMYSLEPLCVSGDNIITTIMEHHSNFIPWFELAKRKNLEFKAVHPPFEQNILSSVNSKTKIVSFTMMSNVSGEILNVKKLVRKIKEINNDCIVIVDAAQGVAHCDVDVKDLGCDFLVFSGHKVYGPLGVGVVYGRKNVLESLSPAMFGGGMVLDYRQENFVFEEVPYKFESGSLDVASISGLAEALNFFSKIKDKFEREKELNSLALSELKKIKGLKIIGHDNGDYGPVISFTLKNIHPHDLASIADSFNVCIRAGHHCAKPYLNYLGVDALARVSLSFYNDKADVLKLIDAIKKAKVIFDE